jgi:trk system potassium uptake protein TrkH
MSVLQAFRNHPFAVAQRVVGILLVGFSATQLVPFGVSVIYGDGAARVFLLAFAVNLFVGALLWFPVRRQKGKELRLRDGSIVVVMFWLVLGLFGAIPLFFADQPWMTFSQAVFESISGLTTTGATVISGLDSLPQAVLWYRTQLQWLGGMGIIVLAVAVLPLLGVGGMQLFRAEMPGPLKEDKFTPRVREGAKALWFIYIGLTGICFLAYWGAGMDIFDAITHSFSTLATGGFGNYDTSLGHYHNTLILSVAMVFMWLGGVSFALHFSVLRGRNPLIYLRNVEFRNYTIILLVALLVVAVVLFSRRVYSGFFDALADASFQVVSVMTSTGFTSTNFARWPVFLPIGLMLLACLGGCAGSTSGGIKVVRLTLLFKQARRQIINMVHPSAELPVKLGDNPVPRRIMENVWAFFFIYVISFMGLVLLLMLMGLPGLTAFAAIAASISNMGPGLGEVAHNYASLGPGPLWVLIFAMLWGRLEIFTVLLLFTPAFWRR